MAFIELFGIVRLFADEPKIVKRGENAVNSGHIVCVTQDTTVGVIKGKVQASIKDKAYDVEECCINTSFCREISLNFFPGQVTVTDDRMIETVQCSCPRGQFKCHHIAALLIWANKNLSCTDIPCQWKIKKKTSDKEVVRVSNMYPHPNPEYTPLSRPVGQADGESIFETLQNMGNNSGLEFLLTDEPETQGLTVATFEDIIFSLEYAHHDDKPKYILEKLAVTPEQIQIVQELTKRQRKSQHWLMYRKGRLTASNFGRVLEQIRRNSFPPSLFKTLLGEYHAEGAKSVMFGVSHESDAVQQWENARMETQECGLFLHHTGIIGATPDRLVGTDGLLEVKCLYSCSVKAKASNCTTPIDSAIATKNFPIILVSGQEKILESHAHWHQIQGQLHMTGRSVGHLVYWTPQQMKSINVLKSEEWGRENIPKLLEFYNKYLLPKLLDGGVALN